MAAFTGSALERRIRFVFPMVQGGDDTPAAMPRAADGHVAINVHSKVMIVDDVFLRVGSANLNNRSMGFDTELDLAVEAETAAHRTAIAAIRFVDEILDLKRSRPMLKWAIRALVAAAVAALVIVVWQLLPFDRFDVVASVEARIEGLRASAGHVPLVLLAFLVGGVVAFPIVVMIGATIVAFGPLEGFILASLGTMLAASSSFCTGRLLGRRLLERVFGARLLQFERRMHGRGVIAVALIRKVPGPPFTVVNMLIAASGIRFREFLAGTALGMVPGIGVFSLLGDWLADVWRNPTPLRVILVAAAVALWIGVLLGAQRLVNRFSQK